MEINKPVITIILFIINLVLIFLFVGPEYRELLDSRVILAQKQAEYISRSDYQKKIAEILGDIEARQNILKKVDSALPSDFYFGNTVYFLQAKAVESGLDVKSITFSETTQIKYQPILEGRADQEIKGINFILNLSGKYQGLKNFLFSLEKSARLFEIDNISFASSGRGNLQNQSEEYNFKLGVRMYTY